MAVETRPQISETSHSPEHRSVEEIMKPDVDSFGQIVVVREHILADGSVVRKGVGISLPQLPGMNSQMREDVITQALDIEIKPEDHRDGLEEGQIFWGDQDLTEEPNLETLIRKFVQTNGEILAQQHPYKTHPKVKHYLSLQDQRQDFVPTILADALNILMTPEFTGWSSINSKYRGEGKLYLVEYFYKDGVAYGSGPTGLMTRLDLLATDDPHQYALENGLISTMSKPMKRPGGWRKGGNGENTETAKDCEGGCAAYFEYMLGKLGVESNQPFITITDPGGTTYSLENPYYCKKHRTNKKICNCIN